MKMRIDLLLLALVSSITVLSVSNIALASPDNWSEVVRFTGSGSEHYTTDYFTCEHVEWRILWEYVPDPDYPELAIFNVYTYPEGEEVWFTDCILKTGAENTSGNSYIHNEAGTFYMVINIANTETYTIVVEQDLDSIPEFPSFLILPLFMTATLLVIIMYRKNSKSANLSLQLM